MMDLWLKVNATCTIVAIVVLLCGIEKWAQGKEEHKYMEPIFVKLSSFSVASWIVYSLFAIWL